MFETGSASAGTTTTGADISTAILSEEYTIVLGEHLERSLLELIETFPLFLIDSEGMGVRGDEFDFVTTSPPAVIAKVIIWIGSENLQTAEILMDIDDYLRGLDNIILDESSRSTRETICSSPRYGHFVIIINKMMGDLSDEELYSELMNYEPDFMEGATERNLVRQKLNECFQSVSLHGLPYLTLQDGEEFGYPVLNDRFRDGLQATANTILNSIPVPKVVSVANLALEFNATNAEIIIDTVIEEANTGVIDLSSCSTFWRVISKDINDTLHRSSEEFQIIDSKCEFTGTSFMCTECICSYRQDLVNAGVDLAMLKLDSAVALANVNGCEESIDAGVAKIVNQVINPWQLTNMCDAPSAVSKPSEITVCDSSEVDFLTPGEDFLLACDLVFLCGQITVDANRADINADK